jgi:hypothetical protein
MTTKQHWEGIYTTKPAIGVSWYAPHLQHSLELIERAADDRDARIIDVGGGARMSGDQERKRLRPRGGRSFVRSRARSANDGRGRGDGTKSARLGSGGSS